MRKPKVSIIVPVYNAEETLGRCIDSILMQTYKDFELILVNDGSVDNSRAVLEKYSAGDIRVTCINRQENEGVSAARNQGIKCAAGEWIVFVDADDYLADNCLESAVHAVQEITPDMVFWNRVDVFKNGNKKRRVFRNEMSGKLFSGNELIPKIFYNPDGNLGLGSAYCNMFRKDVIIKNHLHFPEDMRHGEDVIFELDFLMSAGQVLWIDEFTYFRTIREDSVMHSFNAETDRHMLKLADEFEKRVGSADDSKIREAYAVCMFRGPVTRYLECFICHKRNHENHSVRRRQLKSFMAVPVIDKAVKNISYRKLPVRLRIKLFCVRHQLLFVLDRWYRSKSYL